MQNKMMGAKRPPHHEGQGHSNELWFFIIFGHEHGQLQSIIRFQEKMIEAIRYIKLGHVLLKWRCTLADPTPLYNVLEGTKENPRTPHYYTERTKSLATS